jgi:hypothetical protein
VTPWLSRFLVPAPWLANGIMNLPPESGKCLASAYELCASPAAGRYHLLLFRRLVVFGWTKGYRSRRDIYFWGRDTNLSGLYMHNPCICAPVEDAWGQNICQECMMLLTQHGKPDLYLQCIAWLVDLFYSYRLKLPSHVNKSSDTCPGNPRLTYLLPLLPIKFLRSLIALVAP